MTMRRHRYRRSTRTQRRRLRGGTNKRTHTRKGTTIKGKMPSSVKDGLRGTRITGILRKDSEHWQPRKKATNTEPIEIHKWSVHSAHGSHIPSSLGTVMANSFKSIFASRSLPYRVMIRQTLINANHLQELGYYIEDIHSSTSRPVYSKDGDDAVPTSSTDFVIFYRVYKPSELKTKDNRRPINVVYWRRDSVNGQALDEKQALFLSKHLMCIDHLSTTVDSYTPNTDKLFMRALMPSVPTRMDMRHQAEWFYA